MYDGPQDQVGTIRIHRRAVRSQDLTVVAELVAPGRSYLDGYGKSGVHHARDGFSISSMISHATNKSMISHDLASIFLEDDPLLLAGTDGTICPRHWTVTPFCVVKEEWFPRRSKQVLGRLWLYSPGCWTPSQMFQKAHNASSQFSWKVRGTCYMALLVGWCLTFEPISNIRHVPLLHSLVSLFFFCLVGISLGNHVLHDLYRRFSFHCTSGAAHFGRCHCLDFAVGNLSHGDPSAPSPR